MNPLDVLSHRAERLVTIDFETYYSPEYTLSKSTTADYVRDPRFETIGCGVEVDDGGPVWLNPEQWADFAARCPWDTSALLAHHTHFDGFIGSHHYGVVPAFYFDTLSMARLLHGAEVGGSLAKLMPKYGMGEKGVEVVKAFGKRRRDFTPEEYAAYGEYCRNDVRGCKGIFQKMMVNGFPHIELWNIDTTIRMFTQPTLVLDEPMLTEFLAYEQQRKADLLARIEAEKADLMSNDKFAQLLFDLGVEPGTKINAKGNEAWAFAKSDPFMQGLLEHEDDEVRWIAEARVGLKSTINETRTGRFLKLGAGGRPAPVYLKYAAAHTFRWGGADKMNWQNLERIDKKNPRKGVIRKSIRVPPGKEIVVCDSGQIEARITAWLAGQTDLVTLFADRSRDVYSEEGSAYFGETITKETHPDERQLSKCMVLGMGFGMGWYKFAAELLKGMMGTKPRKFTQEDVAKFGVNVVRFSSYEPFAKRINKMPSRLPLDERFVHCAVAQELVNRYRVKNSQIKALWEDMDVVLGMMVIEDAPPAPFGPGCYVMRHGIMLPNRTTLRYPGLREDDGQFSYMGGRMAKERHHIYGGMLTENVVQALARIVVADQMLYLRGAYGYHVANMTHDEVILTVNQGEGERALERMVDVMRQAPEWAVGLPLNAEGGVGHSYGEAKK